MRVKLDRGAVGGFGVGVLPAQWIERERQRASVCATAVRARPSTWTTSSSASLSDIGCSAAWLAERDEALDCLLTC